MLYYSLSFSIHIVKYYLFLISHFCYYWFLRFPLPRLITPQTTFDCRVPMPTIREATPTANTNENLDRTTSYHTPTAVAIPMPQIAPRTNCCRRRRRVVVVVSSLLLSPLPCRRHRDTPQSRTPSTEAVCMAVS